MLLDGVFSLNIGFRYDVFFFFGLVTILKGYFGNYGLNCRVVYR